MEEFFWTQIHTGENKKIKEAIFIDCLNPNVEISSRSKIMNLQKGTEISNCWKEFNGKIRNVFSKKFKGHRQIQENSLCFFKEKPTIFRRNHRLD